MKRQFLDFNYFSVPIRILIFSIPFCCIITYLILTGYIIWFYVFLFLLCTASILAFLIIWFIYFFRAWDMYGFSLLILSMLCSINAILYTVVLNADENHFFSNFFPFLNLYFYGTLVFVLSFILFFILVLCFPLSRLEKIRSFSQFFKSTSTKTEDYNNYYELITKVYEDYEYIYEKFLEDESLGIFLLNPLTARDAFEIARRKGGKEFQEFLKKNLDPKELHESMRRALFINMLTRRNWEKYYQDAVEKHEKELEQQKKKTVAKI